MLIPNRPKALQEYLISLWLAERVWFLKVESWDWPAIVFNEWNRATKSNWNLDYEKWVDIFPILIDVVVKYEDYMTWYRIRNTIRKNIWKFNWQLTNDWEWTIAFRQFLAPSFNHETNEIIFWTVYLLKQNFDFEDEEVLDNQDDNNANDTNQELTEWSDCEC